MPDILRVPLHLSSSIAASAFGRALDAGLADIEQQGAPGQVRPQAEHGRPDRGIIRFDYVMYAIGH